MRTWKIRIAGRPATASYPGHFLWWRVLGAPVDESIFLHHCIGCLICNSAAQSCNISNPEQFPYRLDTPTTHIMFSFFTKHTLLVHCTYPLDLSLPISSFKPCIPAVNLIKSVLLIPASPVHFFNTPYTIDHV